MTRLRDLAREIVSVSEGELLQREQKILALRREVERLKKELAETKRQQLTTRPLKCETCAYRVVGMRVLEAEETAKSEGGLSDDRK